MTPGLLPQPRGFESFRRIPASVSLHEMAVPDPEGHRHVDLVLNSAAGTAGVPSGSDHHPFALVSKQVDLGKPILGPVRAQAFELPEDRLSAAERPGFRPSLGSRYNGVLCPPGAERLSLLEPVDGSQDDFHVLLRHRPRSISRSASTATPLRR